MSGNRKNLSANLKEQNNDSQMDITDNLKVLIFKTFITFFSFCTLLWLSVIFYALLYYFYIPAVAHIKAVHLQYDMSCLSGKHCYPKFPYDNITLIEAGNECLRGGQGYAIEVILEMPESERNWIQGIFMIKLDMLNYSGKVVKSSSRAAMLRYRSSLFKIFYTLFFMPGLLAGSVEEKQSLVVPLFEDYVEESYNPAHFAHVEIQAKDIEVYSSSLRIHAKFTGLRYLMYYWPVTSAVIGVGGNFLFLIVTISLIWFYESTKTPSEEPNLGFVERFRQFQLRSRKSFEPPSESPFEREDTTEIENMEDDSTLEETAFDEIIEVGRLSEVRQETIEVENIPRHRVAATDHFRDEDD